MITRRACLAAGGSAAVGATLGLAHASRAATGWRAIRSGTSIAFNGINYEAECGENPAAIQVSGSGVVRFSMIPGNFWKKDSIANSERTELDGWRTQLSREKVIWSSWSMFYEPGEWSTSDWCIVRQIYHIKGLPMPHILKPNGELLWVGAAGTDKPNDNRIRHRQKIEQGRWLNFVEACKFDPEGGAGYWRSWLDGKQVLDWQGALGSKGAELSYVKFGVYRGIRKTWDGIVDIVKNPDLIRVKETVSIRYANLRYGHADLSHLIAKPEPIPAWEPWSPAG